jgi:hypothetical protein
MHGVESLTANNHSASQEISCLLWNLKVVSQEPATGPCPEPDESSPF